MKSESPVSSLLLSLAVALGSSWAWAQSDEPNYPKEDRFHEIYQKFNQAPVSEETWDKAYQVSKPREYQVVKTDTLWDISKVLFADPVFWPKIWSFNTDQITNPHEIKPGQKIQFYPGTLDAPPAMVVVEFEGVALPSTVAPKNLGKIPDSLPPYKFDIPDFELPKILKADRSALEVIPPLPLPVEIVAERPEFKGRLVELQDGARMVGEGRDIYVELNRDARPGHYTVVKIIEKNRFGFIVQYRGEIQVNERINDGENVYRAKLIKLLDGVEVGDRIIPGKIPDVNIESKAVTDYAPYVRVIGGFRSPTDMLFAPYSIVFLDGGIQEGLREGDVLNIFQDPRLRISGTKQQKAYRRIGHLKVIRVQQQVATAYILDSTSEIVEGDLAGADKTNSGSKSNPDDDELSLD